MTPKSDWSNLPHLGRGANTVMQTFKPLEWHDGAVIMLDQRLLPAEEKYTSYHSAAEVGDAIRAMVIRGAPAIGCAAALGVALDAASAADEGAASVRRAVQDAASLLANARPTAVNLFWALERCRRAVDQTSRNSGPELAQTLLDLGLHLIEEDGADNRRMGRHGADLLPAKVSILTHCNTGALATGGWGTALGIIRSAVEMGKDVRVFADETRPWLQGARLTAWELQKDNIDVTVIPDSAAASLMQRGEVDTVIVGADRITATGDVANKIGTYSLAILCQHHGLPFYVAAPTSTIDPLTTSGDEIPIEERPEEEVTIIGGTRFVPRGVPARNMAFDVTPSEMITAIITEQGVVRQPYDKNLARALGKKT